MQNMSENLNASISFFLNLEQIRSIQRQLTSAEATGIPTSILVIIYGIGSKFLQLNLS